MPSLSLLAAKTSILFFAVRKTIAEKLSEDVEEPFGQSLDYYERYFLDQEQAQKESEARRVKEAQEEATARQVKEAQEEAEAGQAKEAQGKKKQLLQHFLL